MEETVEPDVRVRRVTVGDGWARVSSVPGAEGRHLLLVPGIGMGASSFERLGPRLRKLGAVSGVDLPGFAGTSGGTREVGIAALADELEAIVADLGIPTPVLIGHSMGAQVVVELASRRPDLTHVVLISPVLDPAARRFTNAAWRFLRASRHESAAVVGLALSSYLLTGMRSFARMLPHVIGFDPEDRLPDVQAEVLIIRGEFDALLPEDFAGTLADLCDARLWTIEGAAHSVMHEYADGVAALVTSFLNDDLAARGTMDRATARRPMTRRERARTLVPQSAARVREIYSLRRGDDRAVERAKGRRLYREP